MKSGFRGGALLNQIYSCMDHGDPFVRSVAMNLLDKVWLNILALAYLCQTSKPFFETLSGWIQEGKLEDPYKEFFVALENSHAEDVWRHKYSLQPENVPRFISPTIVNEVSLNRFSKLTARSSRSVKRSTSSAPSAKKPCHRQARTLRISCRVRCRTICIPYVL